MFKDIPVSMFICVRYAQGRGTARKTEEMKKNTDEYLETTQTCIRFVGWKCSSWK